MTGRVRVGRAGPSGQRALLAVSVPAGVLASPPGGHFHGGRFPFTPVLAPPPTWGLAPTRLWCLPCGLRPGPSAIVVLMLMSVNANIEATANSEYLYLLLREKDPGFLAVLELAVNRVDRELYGECPEAARR